MIVHPKNIDRGFIKDLLKSNGFKRYCAGATDLVEAGDIKSVFFTRDMLIIILKNQIKIVGRVLYFDIPSNLQDYLIFVHVRREPVYASFHRFPPRSTSSTSKNDDHLVSKAESDDGIHTLTLGTH